MSQLRRESLQAQRVKMEQERWEEKLSEIAQRERDAAEKAVRRQAIWERTKAEFPALRPLDELEEEYEALRKPRARGKGKARGGAQEEAPEGNTKTVAKKACPQPGVRSKRRGGKANNRVRRSLTLPGGEEKELTKAAGESNQIKPNQGCGEGKSNQIKPNQTCEGEVEGSQGHDRPEGGQK